MISVSDTGTGMHADILKRAVEPFFTTKEIGKGTGLGLSQVYGFLKQSGGHLKLYSEVSLGTVVKIYLRRTQGGKIPQADEEHPLAVPVAGRAETILLVEDDADVRRYLSDLLQDLNFKVHAADGGPAALRYIQSGGHLDLLLTDVVMPGMNGRELGRAVGENLPDVPVLYMTGYSRNVLIREGRLEEGLDVLHKPVSQAELSDRLQKALRRRRSRHDSME